MAINYHIFQLPIITVHGFVMKMCNTSETCPHFDIEVENFHTEYDFKSFLPKRSGRWMLL